ncbi:MAG TPA: TIR domain-containing protein [Ktedonobacteraceae bacterium]|jgi:hypothetical protein
MKELQGNQWTPFSVFISYAREDERLRQQLETHLSLLLRQGWIADWHDRQILPGGEWAHDIDEHLEAASIILLLISPAFLASKYCFDTEMQRALERHQTGKAQVIPILLRPVQWQDAPFAHLQVLPTDAKPITKWRDRNEAFSDIVRGICWAISTLRERRVEHLPDHFDSKAGETRDGSNGSYQTVEVKEFFQACFPQLSQRSSTGLPPWLRENTLTVFQRTIEGARLSSYGRLTTRHVFLALLELENGISSEAISHMGGDVMKIAEELSNNIERLSQPVSRVEPTLFVRNMVLGLEALYSTKGVENFDDGRILQVALEPPTESATVADLLSDLQCTKDQLLHAIVEMRTRRVTTPPRKKKGEDE